MSGELRIVPIYPLEDGGTGDRWAATWGQPGQAWDYDGSGATIEEALAALARELGTALEKSGA